MKIEDENSREISLSIRRRGMLLSIHEENYYAVEPVKHGENFETSKEDQAHHGFGTRSYPYDRGKSPWRYGDHCEGWSF